MQRYGFRLFVQPDKIEEYKKRHDAIWPEMTQMLNEAGIHNYSIWNVGNELFGYYECESIEYAAKVQRESKITALWSAYMSDVMEKNEVDPDTGVQPMLRQVFYHP